MNNYTFSNPTYYYDFPETVVTVTEKEYDAEGRVVKEKVTVTTTKRGRQYPVQVTHYNS